MTQALAAVFEGQAGKLALRSFPIPRPRGAEILVRVLGCTLCGSDLHSFTGRRPVPVPTVLGHEIVGEIVDFGSEAVTLDLAGQEIRQGDRVTWAIVANCGKCFFCVRDLPQKCLRAVKYGHERLQPGREFLGGLAEYCLLVPGTAVVRLPEELPLAVACPASCATATIAAAWEAAGNLQGGKVCLFGAGLLGLTACAMARVLGAAEVVCIDPVAARRERAQLFGATRVADPIELSTLAKFIDQGFDSVLELSGQIAAFNAAWTVVRTGGTLVLVGSVFPDAPVPIELEQIVRRHLTIRGIHNYAPRHLLAAVRFLAEHHRKFPFAELVEQWFPLTEVEAAFSQAGKGAIRIGIGG